MIETLLIVLALIVGAIAGCFYALWAIQDFLNRH